MNNQTDTISNTSIIFSRKIFKRIFSILYGAFLSVVLLLFHDKKEGEITKQYEFKNFPDNITESIKDENNSSSISEKSTKSVYEDEKSPNYTKIIKDKQNSSINPENPTKGVYNDEKSDIYTGHTYDDTSGSYKGSTDDDTSNSSTYSIDKNDGLSIYFASKINNFLEDIKRDKIIASKSPFQRKPEE